MASPDGMPRAIAKRLPLYHQSLAKLRKQGKCTVSSKELSKEVGVEATMIRKDMAFFGELGKRGVGYNVELLYRTIGRKLNLDQHWETVIVGVGKMAAALVEFNCLYGRNFRIVAAFNPEPALQNHTMVEHLPVQPLSFLPSFAKDNDIKIAILATTAAQAQMSANTIVQANIRSILNFSPVEICVPEDLKVINDIITTEMQILACYLDGMKNNQK
ncbi:MAG: redox-sensing transcriptional repressor Rex [Firmicutes bacterium]|nr:redox-sensing transcriptional repressor Rex [Bacillota bacterium]